MMTEQTRANWKTWQYWARLTVFAFVVGFLTIIVGQILFLHLEVDVLIAPFPSAVAMPEDFDVEAVTFTGGDNLTLSGWYVAPENGAVIILLHGYDGNRTQVIWQARQLVDAGFGVLLYDLRGHGESAGEQRSNGWRDVDDVAGALHFLVDKADAVGIYGFSVGGQVALRAAASYPVIQAVFVDGPSGVSARDLPPPATIQEQFVFGLAPIGDYMLSRRTETAIPQSITEILPAISPRPIFFVATRQHPVIPGGEIRMVRPFYELVQSHADIWDVSDTGHGGAWGMHPEDYARYLIGFFERSLLNPA